MNFFVMTAFLAFSTLLPAASGDDLTILRCTEIVNGRLDPNALLKLVSIVEPFEIITNDGDFGQGEDEMLRSYYAYATLRLEYMGDSIYPDRLLDETEDHGHILPPGNVLISPISVYGIAFVSGRLFSSGEHEAQRSANGNIRIEDTSDWREQLQYTKTLSYNAQTHQLSLSISRDHGEELIVSAKLQCTAP